MENFDKRNRGGDRRRGQDAVHRGRAALADQLRYRNHIRQGQERLVARMHNHVTTLEKFQLAATGLEAARASATGANQQLDELSQSVAASGEGARRDSSSA